MASLHPELHSIHPHHVPPLAFASSAVPPLRGNQEDAPTHVLLRSAKLEPGEFERSELSTVEVLGLWGSTILFATHLSPVRDFLVGEGSKLASVDYEIPATGLGAASFKLVEVRGGVSYVNVPEGARAELKRAHDSSFAPTDARSIALFAGTTVELTLGRLRFRVANVAAGQTTPRAGLKSAERSVLASFGVSFGVVAALVASFAFWMPALGLTDDEELDRDRLETMKQYLSAQAERNRDEEAEKADSGQKDNQSGAPAEAAQGRAGALGKPLAQATNRRAAVAGDSPLTELSRAQAVEAARHFGMIDLLGSLSSASSSSSPFERNTALGHDRADAEGGMWGDEIGESGGNGLGFAGPDNGGGGHGTGVGIGDVGSLGTCGTANCGPAGFGRGVSLGHREHTAASPSIRSAGNTTVSGTLPAEIVQRIVRQNYGRFRMCYESGLRGNPNLSGRVTARFVIGRDGAVSNVANGGSDMPDSGVVSCVVQAFYGLSFPAPDNGIVRVSYPIMFSPG
ncbi:MAG TPA: AgmX/PglI C-terminal domain-containing protein [Polyangiaceae bacterium]|jgi:hypothetical protein|nr:AgmX/PglI C-terminal domain-containing protein [Polyangiaceae bacterium]